MGIKGGFEGGFAGFAIGCDGSCVQLVARDDGGFDRGEGGFPQLVIRCDEGSSRLVGRGGRRVRARAGTRCGFSARGVAVARDGWTWCDPRNSRRPRSNLDDLPTPRPPTPGNGISVLFVPSGSVGSRYSLNSSLSVKYRLYYHRPFRHPTHRYIRSYKRGTRSSST